MRRKIWRTARVCSTTIAVLAILGVVAARADETAAGGVKEEPAAKSLSAGSAAIDITPDVNLINWVNQKPHGKVLDPLYVRALVLSDGAARVVFLALDLVENRESFSADVRAAITKDLGVAGDHIVLNASHSHSAPFPPPGNEPLIVPEKKLMLPQLETDLYRAWSARLLTSCVNAAKQADAARRPATLGLARAWVGDVLFNRRPVGADGIVKTTLVPANPYALPAGLRFGPVDPTLTWLSLHDESGKPIAAAYHLAAHAVSVYGEDPGLSADWPGAVGRALKTKLGIDPLFLQGCAGDIVPARRGIKHAEAMGHLIAERAAGAEANWQALPDSPLTAARREVDLPYSERARAETQRPSKRSEVQLVTYGSLAIIALPGEPLTKIGQAIQERSPFPHTLVLGYSNGSGVEYIGIAGEKAKGGYEMGEWGLGTDEAGPVLIEAAVKLLEAARR